MGSRLARVCRISTLLYLQRVKALAGTVLCARRAEVEQTESRHSPPPRQFYYLDLHTLIV